MGQASRATGPWGVQGTTFAGLGSSEDLGARVDVLALGLSRVQKLSASLGSPLCLSDFKTVGLKMMSGCRRLSRESQLGLVARKPGHGKGALQTHCSISKPAEHLRI